MRDCLSTSLIHDDQMRICIFGVIPHHLLRMCVPPESSGPSNDMLRNAVQVRYKRMFSRSKHGLLLSEFLRSLTRTLGSACEVQDIRCAGNHYIRLEILSTCKNFLSYGHSLVQRHDLAPSLDIWHCVLGSLRFVQNHHRAAICIRGIIAFLGIYLGILALQLLSLKLITKSKSIMQNRIQWVVWAT
jgi:hypothetical protein